MSHVSVKPASAGQPSLEELFALGSRLLATSIDSARIILRQAAGLLPSMPDVRHLIPCEAGHSVHCLACSCNALREGWTPRGRRLR